MLEARITCVLSLLTVGLCLQLPSAAPPRGTVVMKGQAVAAKPKAKGGFGAKTAKTTKKKRAPVVQLPMPEAMAALEAAIEQARPLAADAAAQLEAALAQAR